ncbi:hypothetical protein H2204_008583 [Knufia peltigerae]|uniref:Uncharacterized protein n=1 Tax=Knufia peltigerae TaxID=1002370 RepID=A0AA38XZP2_9EURO|nr:hypothetical protein H2204_008583 [Knufia peltigerae]
MNNSNHRVVRTPKGGENGLKIKKNGTRSKKIRDPIQNSGNGGGQPEPQDHVHISSQRSTRAHPRNFSDVVSGKASNLSITKSGGIDGDKTTVQYGRQNHGDVYVNRRQTSAFRGKEISTSEEDWRDFPLPKSTTTPYQRSTSRRESVGISEPGCWVRDTARSDDTPGSTQRDSTGRSKGKHDKQTQTLVVKSELGTRPFRFDDYDLRLRCWKPDCGKMTSCWDCSVVICPGCGPDSYVRYCSSQHLYDDIQYHWVYHCGKHGITDTIDRTTIRLYQNPPRPYIVNEGFNSIERHRQAVYRSLEPGDFFLFDDAGLLKPDFIEPTREEWNIKRGTGPCVLQLFFPDDMTDQSMRHVFNTDIFECLGFGGPRAAKSCLRALHLIRESLILSGNWTEQALDLLCLQVAGEWGGFKVPESFYNVGEANLAWQTQGTLPPTP